MSWRLEQSLFDLLRQWVSTAVWAVKHVTDDHFSPLRCKLKILKVIYLFIYRFSFKHQSVLLRQITESLNVSSVSHGAAVSVVPIVVPFIMQAVCSVSVVHTAATALLEKQVIFKQSRDFCVCVLTKPFLATRLVTDQALLFNYNQANYDFRKRNWLHVAIIKAF